MASNPTLYPQIDSSAIVAKIHEINMTVEATNAVKLRYIADYLGINEVTLRRKINNELEWKLSEIVKIQKALGLTDKEREKIFFGK